MLKRIDGRYVHKNFERNVLLADVRRRADSEEWFEAEMVHDMDHPFFFEHPLDHVPAMMLVETGRQLGIAISHLYLGVPLGTMFATRSFDIRFTDFAETRKPVQITAHVTDRQYRRGALIHLRMDGYFSQQGRQLGSMGGTWSMLDPQLWKRYRRLEQWRNRAV
jgi:2-oxo-3-(phosphooxy)propyl 3-oxoalkanoate synthase